MTDIAGGSPRRDLAGLVVRPAVLLLCVAIAAYAATIVIGEPWLPRMIVWFLAAVVLHDGVLLPLYSGADRALVALAPHTRVPLVNHVRVPVLGAGLTLLLFLPGIIRQGEDAHLGATGLDQQPYLGRWLLLVAAMVAVSAAVYAVRTVRSPRREQQVRPHRRSPEQHRITDESGRAAGGHEPHEGRE